MFDFEKWLDKTCGTGEYSAERHARDQAREFRPLVEAVYDGERVSVDFDKLRQALRDLGVADD